MTYHTNHNYTYSLNNKNGGIYGHHAACVGGSILLCAEATTVISVGVIIYHMLNDTDRSDPRVAYVELEIISLLRSEYRFSGYDVHGNKLAATKIMSNHKADFTEYLIIELEKTMNLSQYRKEHRHVSLSEEFK